MGDYGLVARFSTTTNQQLNFLDLSGATPTLVGSVVNLSISATTKLGLAIAKVSPWTYVMEGGEDATGDAIIKMTPYGGRVGIAESAIANAATGAITFRFQKAVLSGLTSASLYYVDDNGQPTLQASLTAPQLGIAMNTTEILLS